MKGQGDARIQTHGRADGVWSLRTLFLFEPAPEGRKTVRMRCWHAHAPHATTHSVAGEVCFVSCAPPRSLPIVRVDGRLYKMPPLAV